MLGSDSHPGRIVSSVNLLFMALKSAQYGKRGSHGREEIDRWKHKGRVFVKFLISRKKWSSARNSQNARKLLPSVEFHIKRRATTLCKPAWTSGFVQVCSSICLHSALSSPELMFLSTFIALLLIAKLTLKTHNHDAIFCFGLCNSLHHRTLKEGRIQVSHSSCCGF